MIRYLGKDYVFNIFQATPISVILRWTSWTSRTLKEKVALLYFKGTYGFIYCVQSSKLSVQVRPSFK